MDAAAARERFAAARVARLATASAAGQPHVVPIVFVVVGEVIYSAVDAKPKRSAALRRLANVGENPAVSVLVDHYDEDWSALWWVRADGRARVLSAEDSRTGPEARAAIDALGGRYPQQTVTGAVLAVDVERWSGWSFS